MPIAVLSVAKLMGERSNWRLSHLAMQKLAYIAHMTHMGMYGGAPLVFGHFEAWDYGPVHPQLYQTLKIFGASRVKPDVFQAVRATTDEKAINLIGDVVRTLSDCTPRLVAITHWEKGAWAKHYVPGVKGIEIPDEDILQEYKDRQIEPQR